MSPTSTRPHFAALLCLKWWVLVALVAGWNTLGVTSMWLKNQGSPYSTPAAYLVVALTCAGIALFMFLLAYRQQFAAVVMEQSRSPRFHRPTFVSFGMVLGAFALFALAAALGIAWIGV